MNTDHTIKDSIKGGWVEHMPTTIRPFLRLSRLDRPIGYWLLALPGWIGLAFASLTHGYTPSDMKYAVLILIGAVAMRGAGCTYNDIVDRNLDKQVERTALRPLASGTISVKSAWLWLFAQCLVGLLILLFFPRFSQILALSSLALVAVYPFMKRITYWPQAWLGLTFNWAALVAYSAKTGHITPSLVLLYFGLVFWTIGYDTIYACQDIEDDAMIGVKSTARLFGKHIKIIMFAVYFTCAALLLISVVGWDYLSYKYLLTLPFSLHLFWQVYKFAPSHARHCLKIFKSNRMAALLLIMSLSLPSLAKLL